jgi:hypothetical protein
VRTLRSVKWQSSVRWVTKLLVLLYCWTALKPNLDVVHDHEPLQMSSQLRKLYQNKITSTFFLNFKADLLEEFSLPMLLHATLFPPESYQVQPNSLPLISLQQNNMSCIKYEVLPYVIFSFLYLIHLSEHFFIQSLCISTWTSPLCKINIYMK